MIIKFRTIKILTDKNTWSHMRKEKLPISFQISLEAWDKSLGIKK